jgi:predicted RNA-binding Zn-ribbon protein involved in translation (DUF1610 family)
MSGGTVSPEEELQECRKQAPLLDCPVCGTTAEYSGVAAVGMVKFPDATYIYHECPRCHHMWVPKESE